MGETSILVQRLLNKAFTGKKRERERIDEYRWRGE
jgi:hypothetical protein